MTPYGCATCARSVLTYRWGNRLALGSMVARSSSSRCARLAELEIGTANHLCSIHERAIVEAFPNLFLGTLCDENKYPKKPSTKRKWTDTLFPLVAKKLRLLLSSLLPNREIAGRWGLVDHDEIASFAR
jgi:hypothetical protein